MTWFQSQITNGYPPLEQLPLCSMNGKNIWIKAMKFKQCSLIFRKRLILSLTKGSSINCKTLMYLAIWRHWSIHIYTIVCVIMVPPPVQVMSFLVCHKAQCLPLLLLIYVDGLAHLNLSNGYCPILCWWYQTFIIQGRYSCFPAGCWHAIDDFGFAVNAKLCYFQGRNAPHCYIFLLPIVPFYTYLGFW